MSMSTSMISCNVHFCRCIKGIAVLSVFLHPVFIQTSLLIPSFLYSSRLPHLLQLLHRRTTIKPPLPPSPSLQFNPSTPMCYKLVERFSVCRCLYFQHAIDPCEAFGQRGHTVQEKVVLVGYTCSRHGTVKRCPGIKGFGG